MTVPVHEPSLTMMAGTLTKVPRLVGIRSDPTTLQWGKSDVHPWGYCIIPAGDPLLDTEMCLFLMVSFQYLTTT